MEVLSQLAQDGRWTKLVEQDLEHVVNLYESVFDHHAFTGRSGGMYGYEGIGCTYWHMVAKLLVASGECVQDAQGAPSPFKSDCVRCTTASEMALASAARRISSARTRLTHIPTLQETVGLSNQA